MDRLDIAPSEQPEVAPADEDASAPSGGSGQEVPEPSAEPAVPAAQQPDEGQGFLAEHKGDLALAGAVVLVLIGLAVRTLSPVVGSVILSMGEASLVGGLCDLIALRMLFRRLWYLPGSGLIPRNREALVRALARTVEEDWLSRRAIFEHLQGIDWNLVVGKGIAGLADNEELIANLASRMSEAGTTALTSKRTVAYLLERFAESAGPLAGVIRGIQSEKVAEWLQTRIKPTIESWMQREETLAQIRDRLEETAKNLGEADEPILDEAITSQLIDAILRAVPSGEIAHIVESNLSRHDDEMVARFFEERTRIHLEWIRVNGGLFGALFGLVLGLLRSLVA